MALAAILAGLSILSGNKQRKEQKKATAAQNQIVTLRNQRARIDAIKEYRIARAQVVAGVTGSGAGKGSSALPGISGSLGTQLKTNLEENIKEERLGAEYAKRTDNANKFAFIGQALQLGANIGQAVRDVRPVNESPFAQKE